MAEWKPPGKGDNPLTSGYRNLPGGGEPGGRGPIDIRNSPGIQKRAQIARVKRGVYKAARKEALSITRETAMKRAYDLSAERARKTKIQEMSSSDYWGNKGLASMPAEVFGRKTDFPMGRKIKGANDQGRGKSSETHIVVPDSRLEVKNTPFESAFKAKMRFAREGRTKGGQIVGDNENVRKPKK